PRLTASALRSTHQLRDPPPRAQPFVTAPSDPLGLLCVHDECRGFRQGRLKLGGSRDRTLQIREAASGSRAASLLFGPPPKKHTEKTTMKEKLAMLHAARPMNVANRTNTFWFE